MAESFFIAVNAVIPFFCYLALGYGAKCLGKVDTPFLDRLTKLIFSIMFPFMTFNNIYAASRDAIPSRMLLLFVGLAILVVEGLGLWLVPKLIRENSRRGVLIQALYRSNFVLFGIPLTATLYGADQTSIAAMLAAEVLTIYNITSVIILELFNSQGGRIRPKALVGKLLRNPMLQGCCVGLVFFFLGIRLPKCLESPISSFANMTTPLAMFALGGTMEFDALSGGGGLRHPGGLRLLPYGHEHGRRWPPGRAAGVCQHPGGSTDPVSVDLRHERAGVAVKDKSIRIFTNL